ncbi:MAG: nucleoside deaminase [Leptospiraceae bacterium]|nr:nucleoside deaminase [Leptospiraceae bacterium]
MNVLRYCCEALLDAQAQGDTTDVPLYSLIVASDLLEQEAVAHSQPWIGWAANQVSELHNPLAHAESAAIATAAAYLQNERLGGYSLISCLEPCLMCSGAIMHARLDRVYFFCTADKGPGLRYLCNTTRSTPMRLNHYPAIFWLSEYNTRCRAQLQQFFEKKR